MESEFQLRAAFGANSYDPETRIFSAVFSAGAPRTMRDASGPFVEVLDLAGFDPAKLIGKPVFLDHRHSTDSAVGVVLSARHEGAAIVGEVQLSAAESVGDIRTKVSEGVIAAVSVGYRVTRWVEGRDASGRRTKTAAAGELVELSLVGIPADPQAKIRSEICMEPEDIQTTDEQKPAETPRIRSHVAPTGSEDPAAVIALREEALACRMSGDEPSAGARQFMALGFAEHAGLSLRAAGETGLHNLSREAILHRAMGTSDFPLLLTGAGNRTLRASYERAESPLKALAKRELANDFRANDSLQLGGMGLLEEVTESGEITSTTTAEAKTTWALKTFGKTFNLTRKAIINDDLGAFGRVTAELGRAAAETENTALANLLLSNPTMPDGIALFHTGHGNDASTGSILTNDTLSLGREAMRAQTGITGELINVAPKFLVTGPVLETLAEMLLANVAAVSWDMRNPFAGKLQLAVDPRIKDQSFYLFGDPATAPVLLLGHLASAPGPQISSREGWEVLGREFRVVLDFGVAVVDHRGGYRNVGTANRVSVPA